MRYLALTLLCLAACGPVGHPEDIYKPDPCMDIEGTFGKWRTCDFVDYVCLQHVFGNQCFPKAKP